MDGPPGPGGQRVLRRGVALTDVPAGSVTVRIAVARATRIRTKTVRTRGPTSRAPGARAACSTDSARRRPRRSRGGRVPDGCGRAATDRRAGASTARPRRPPPSADRGRHRRGGSSRARAGRRGASSTGTRSRGRRDRRPRRCSCAGTGCARGGTARRRGGRRAALAVAPVARSNSSRPSSTSIVVSNEERTDPFSASQFQPPSASRSPRTRSTIGVDVDPEVGARLDRPTVDARLDLAVEVALPGVLPAPVLGDERDRPPGRVGRGVEAEDLERLQRVHRRRPRLSGFVARVPRREAGAAVPQPVITCERQEAGAPALVLHARPLGGDLVGRRTGEIAQDLPADGGVPLQQPVDHIHVRAG